MNQIPADFVIPALDFDNEADALAHTDKMPSAVFVKVGMELFFASRQQIISQLQERNRRIFLDLKLNDIPKTIERTVSVLCDLQVDYLTLFCEREALARAREIVEKKNSDLKLVLITVLTSMDQSDLDAAGIKQPLDAYLQARARTAVEHGAHALVCSGADLPTLKFARDAGLFCITPGIRPADSPAEDQKRVVTPARAFADGARHIVVGRPLKNSAEPDALLQSMCR